MEPLLFADENAPEWAFSKRKGVKKSEQNRCNLAQPFPKVFLVTFSKSYF